MPLDSGGAAAPSHCDWGPADAPPPRPRRKRHVVEHRVCNADAHPDDHGHADVEQDRDELGVVDGHADGDVLCHADVDSHAHADGDADADTDGNVYAHAVSDLLCLELGVGDELSVGVSIGIGHADGDFLGDELSVGD